MGRRANSSSMAKRRRAPKSYTFHSNKARFKVYCASTGQQEALLQHILRAHGDGTLRRVIVSPELNAEGEHNPSASAKRAPGSHLAPVLHRLENLRVLRCSQVMVRCSRYHYNPAPCEIWVVTFVHRLAARRKSCSNTSPHTGIRSPSSHHSTCILVMMKRPTRPRSIRAPRCFVASPISLLLDPSIVWHMQRAVTTVHWPVLPPHAVVLLISSQRPLMIDVGSRGMHTLESELSPG